MSKLTLEMPFSKVARVQSLTITLSTLLIEKVVKLAMKDKKDKRKGVEPVPEDVEAHLNEPQLCRLRSIEGFGWRIKYIRRPLFQTPVIIVVNSEGDEIGTLEEDGGLNLKPDIEIRT